MATTSQFDYVGGQTRYGKFADFVGLGADSGVACDGFTGVKSNSGTATVTTAVIDGAYTLTTDTSSGVDNAGIVLGLNYRASDNGIVMEAGVKLTSIANVGLFVGFTDTTSAEIPMSMSTATLTTTATDAVGFLYDTAATYQSFMVAGVKNDVDTAVTQVGNAPVAAVYQAFRVQVDTNGYAYFFINGVQVGMQALNQGTGQTGLANAVTTTVALTPVVVVYTRTSGAKIATADFVYVQKGRI